MRTTDTADLDADDAAYHSFIPSGPALPVGN
jgi:hypothetical protein